jgi:hypothetical protein
MAKMSGDEKRYMASSSRVGRKRTDAALERPERSGNLPDQAGDATTWASFSAGDSYTSGTRTDGTLWCWATTPTDSLGLKLSEMAPPRMFTDASRCTTGCGRRAAEMPQ